MSEVKRYFFQTSAGLGCLRGSDCFVLASDYDTLRSANQRLEGEVKRLREAMLAIDRHNDSPARFDNFINDTVQAALSTANGEVTE